MPAAYALDELWHPAAATALERALHPAGHGPNSSSLLRPQAAVVAVASSAEELFIFSAYRSVCGRSGMPFSREGVVEGSGSLPTLVSFGNGRAAGGSVGWTNSSSHGFAVPAPSEMGPLVKPRRSPAKDKLSRTAKGSLCEGAAERSEAEGVLRHRNQILHKMYKDSPLEQLDASVQERVLLYNRYNPQQNRLYYPCKSGTGEFSTGRKACGLCILHRKCAL